MEPILDLSNPVPTDNEIYYEKRDAEQEISNKLKNIYSNKLIIVSSDYEFSIIFKTKKAFNHFCSMCKSYKDTLDEFDLTIDDIDDMLNDQTVYKGMPQLYLSRFALESLLPNILEHSNY